MPAVTPIKRVLLSGWEYNRLLQKNPLTSRASALPSSVLWDGAAQFWLFEEALCTAEALENEQAAGESLGWATGQIFQDLKSIGALRPIELAKDMSAEAIGTLKQVHARLRAGNGTPDRVRGLLRAGDGAGLEGLKQQLLQPVLEDQGCLLDGDPHGLFTWFGGPPTSDTASADGLKRSLEMLVKPVRSSRRRNGLRLCRPFGEGLSAEVVAKWRLAQRAETEMIPELLAGEGPFAGRRGYLAYFEALQQYRLAYEPIEQAVAEDWRRTRPILEALRQRAEKHLWPQLHGEWLPRLQAQDPEFIEEFPRLLRRGILFSPVAELLNVDTQVVVAVAGGGALGVAHLSGLDGETGGSIATVLGGAALAAHKKARSDFGPLALFYQRARRLMRTA